MREKPARRRLRRSDFSALPKDAYTLAGYTREAARASSKSTSSHEFVIEPNAWLEAFGITSEVEQERVNRRLMAHIDKVEERERRKRVRENRRVMGAQMLRRQVFNLMHQSRRAGRRMWCLSEKRSIRVAFIGFLKSLFLKARAVRARWKQGDFSVPYPFGLYPPNIPKLGEPIHIWG